MAVNGELSIAGTRFFYPHRHAHNEHTDTLVASEVVVSDWSWENEAAQVQMLEEDEVWCEYEEEMIEIAKKEAIEKLVIDWQSIDGEVGIFLIDGDSFQMMSEDFLYQTDGSTLKISPKEIWGGHLYIPEDWIGEKIEILVGNGYVYTDRLQADEIVIKMGTGYMESTSIQAENLDLEVATGSLELNEISAEDVEIEIGVGRACIMDATITGDLDVDCGMGELIMHLSGSESDHNYDVSFAGNLNIGNYNHAGFRNKHQKIDNGASSNFHIECGLGNVDFTFDEEY